MPTDLEILKEAFERIGVKVAVGEDMASKYLYIQVPSLRRFVFEKDESWGERKVG